MTAFTQEVARKALESADLNLTSNNPFQEKGFKTYAGEFEEYKSMENLVKRFAEIGGDYINLISVF